METEIAEEQIPCHQSLQDQSNLVQTHRETPRIVAAVAVVVEETVDKQN